MHNFFLTKEIRKWTETDVKSTDKIGPGQKGLSVIEVLVVVALIVVLIAAGWFSYQRQLSKARDAQRKDDLDRLSKAFGDYYNDHEAYPPPEFLLDCGQDSLAPYLKEMPCDPRTRESYVYFSVSGDTSRGYKLLTKLENDDDASIERIGCNQAEGCGWENHPEYNYGIAMGSGMLDDSWELGGSDDVELERYWCVPNCDLPEGCDEPDDYTFSCGSPDYQTAIDYYNCPQAYSYRPDCESECLEPYTDSETGDPISSQVWEEEVACDIPD